MTNAHVVQPYAAVEIRFPGAAGDWHTVDVRGVDGWSDIAVVGPLDGVNAPGLSLTDADRPVQGDRAFLVGYPGEVNESDPVPTITSGIVSQLRTMNALNLHYVQTDAKIAGGQSGGALVNERGQLIGISGSSYAGFSVALATDSVDTSQQHIVAGRATTYDAMLDSPTVTEGPVLIGPRHPYAKYFLWPVRNERDLSITLADPDVPLRIATFGGFRTLLSNEAYETQVVSLSGRDVSPTSRPPQLGVKPGSDGAFTIHLDAGVYVEVLVGPMPRYGERLVNFTSSLPLLPLHGTTAIDLKVRGPSIEGVVNGFEYERVYSVNLTAGQRVKVSVVSMRGGLLLSSVSPDADVQTARTDDSPFGLTYASLDIDATSDGTYFLSVLNGELTPFRISVT